MEKKSRFTKWGYEPVVLNTKAKAVFDKAFDKLKEHCRLLKWQLSDLVMRVAYDEYGDVHYELSFVLDNERHEIIVASVYEFDDSIFKFIMEQANK